MLFKTQALKPRQFAVAASLCLASLLLALCAPAQYFGRQQDDLLYMLASQALAEGSYRMQTVVGRPPLAMISLGLPALLQPVAWLWPYRAEAFQAASLLLQALLPWAVWLWARRRLGEAQAVLVALLSAAHPAVLSQAGAVMSETPYALVMLALLPAADAARAGRVGALYALLTQLRPAGLSLAPAAAAGFIARRRWKDLAAAAAPALILGAAWVWWSRSVTGTVQEADELRRAFDGAHWTKPLATAAYNAVHYARSLGGAFLPRALAAGPAGVLAGAGLLGSAAFGAARALRRRRDDAAAWALAGTAAMHAVWSWGYDRYWIPALPLVWLFCAEAWGRRAVPALAALLAACLACSARPWLEGTSWRRVELARTYDWIGAHVPTSDALASVMFARDGFLSSRPSLPMPRAATARELAESLRRRRVNWALWQADLDVGLPPGAETESLARLGALSRLLEDRAYFERVHSVEEEGSVVYRLKRP